jgi:hypothetical protein
MLTWIIVLRPGLRTEWIAVGLRLVTLELDRVHGAVYKPPDRTGRHGLVVMESIFPPSASLRLLYRRQLKECKHTSINPVLLAGRQSAEAGKYSLYDVFCGLLSPACSASSLAMNRDCKCKNRVRRHKECTTESKSVVEENLDLPNLGEMSVTNDKPAK